MSEDSIRLVFRCAQGDSALVASPGDSVADVCHRYGIPVTQITTYLRNARGDLQLFVDPFAPVAHLAKNATVILFPNRNIDYQALLGGGDLIRRRPGASTWLRLREPGADGADTFVTEFLRPDDAQQFVAGQVREALIATGVTRDDVIVVGVNGGSDSSALISALADSQIVDPDKIRPVMMLGIPDWDRGAERASAMCHDHGLDLQFISATQTAQILGFADPAADWVAAFEAEFPGDDREILGVYAVRRVLEHVALSLDAKLIAVGSNLEDCLSDVLYYLCSGSVPFPKPRGTMGRVDVLFPLWLTPKAVIDGCYPKVSRENFETRRPSRLRGRAYFYYLAQMLVDAYPGAGQDILRGTSVLAKRHFPEMEYDTEFGTPTLRPIPFELRTRLRTLFGAPANAPGPT